MEDPAVKRGERRGVWIVRNSCSEEEGEEGEGGIG